MQKKIKSALISVFYKDGLEPLLQTLHQQQVTIYSTGGTQQFIEALGIACIPVETVTGYPSILGGRVKTLHPKVFGGILGRRYEESDLQEMQAYQIPELDLVIVDLYPFEETVKQTEEEKLIIEKIDIGGPSMIRAAAKNFRDVAVIASKTDYALVTGWLNDQQGELTLEQRRLLASKAFEVVMHYDIAISNYFNRQEQVLRYGENPHQQAVFSGNLNRIFQQLHGKELSYNNLVDVDAAWQLVADISNQKSFCAIIKHTNVCGAALASDGLSAWERALAGDPESAFGGVIVFNQAIHANMATALNEIFFEVLIASSYDADALAILQQKKNRILLQLQDGHTQEYSAWMQKSVLNGDLKQNMDSGNYAEWNEVGARPCTDREKSDLIFANTLCKHLKSNAIALVKDEQMIGKGCGQTSRIDALRHALAKAEQFGFNTKEAVLASDAFFPFDDCVRIADEAGISAFIQPGGSIRDKDSIQYCVDHNLGMVLTGMRHFKH